MMKKILILLLMAQTVPASLLAQDDDLYFVPKEEKEIKKVRTLPAVTNRDTYYCGSNRDVDEYNRRPVRRMRNRLVKVGVDSLGNDVFKFVPAGDTLLNDSSIERGQGRSIEPGGYDEGDDYRCTRRMQRFDGYGGGGMDYDEYCYSYNNGYNRGYVDGLTSWNIGIGWYDPWWYSSRCYGWSGWYNSFYFGWHGPWYGGWYDPWFSGWYNPWWPGSYYPRYYTYYSGISGTSNHSRGAYYGSSRRHGTYNGHSGNKSYRNRHGYNSNRNRGFGNNGSWNNRSNNRSWNNNRGNSRHEINRGGGFGGGNRSGGFGGGHRSGGGGRSGGGRFGGGR